MNEKERVYPLLENKFIHFLFWYSFCVVVGSSFTLFVCFLVAYFGNGTMIININHFGEKHIEFFLLCTGLIASYSCFILVKRELKKHGWRF